MRICLDAKRKIETSFKFSLGDPIYALITTSKYPVKMLEFPKLDNCTHFPLPEGTNLEFKIGFNSSMAEKIYATLCGILNSGGGYLVIGVEDETRRIVGIKTDKSMDYFLLSLDNIYHHGNIKLQDGSPLPIGTIRSGTVTAANDKEVLVVTCTPREGDKYTIKDGSIYYRLAASNFKQTAMTSIYSQTEMDTILRQQLEKQRKMLQSQHIEELRQREGRFQSDNDKLKAKFRSLENDFQCLVRGAKQTEQHFNDFREMLFTNIQLQKAEVEKELASQPKSWYYSLFGCCI